MERRDPENSNMSDADIVKKVLAGTSRSVGGAMGSSVNMTKIAQRARPKKVEREWPEIPENLAEFDIPDELQKLSDGQTKFLLFDTGRY